ncbi:hypothetical protein [Anaerofustis stercorihominis]|uniref:Uncharacterized protein n=1 Tax=Anaerofustis stercorihominis TaxID=214853 RepID=A0A3E3DYQ2_9FIRM|nr:hypothetical protein [Anaerofustis stercorihominis]RGD73828.1 hypothetical protein DW687_08615 [Anaerofustis stercorihominis]
MNYENRDKNKCYWDAIHFSGKESYNGYENIKRMYCSCAENKELSGFAYELEEFKEDFKYCPFCGGEIEFETYD